MDYGLLCGLNNVDGLRGIGKNKESRSTRVIRGTRGSRWTSLKRLTKENRLV